MKTTKKAARIGGDQLLGAIADASTSAKARIAKLDAADLDNVAGGIDFGGSSGGTDSTGGLGNIDDITTAGMVDSGTVDTGMDDLGI